jgi:hypothetical protein
MEICKGDENTKTCILGKRLRKLEKKAHRNKKI